MKRYIHIVSSQISRSIPAIRKTQLLNLTKYTESPGFVNKKVECIIYNKKGVEIIMLQIDTVKLMVYTSEYV